MTTWRRPASRLLFAVACLLLGGALVILGASFLLPYEGIQDLGRVVAAMLVAALATVPFLLALLLGRGTSMPRWMVAASLFGALLCAVPAAALPSARLT